VQSGPSEWAFPREFDFARAPAAPQGAHSSSIIWLQRMFPAVVRLEEYVGLISPIEIQMGTQTGL